MSVLYDSGYSTSQEIFTHHNLFDSEPVAPDSTILISQVSTIINRLNNFRSSMEQQDNKSYSLEFPCHIMQDYQTQLYNHSSFESEELETSYIAADNEQDETEQEVPRIGYQHEMIAHSMARNVNVNPKFSKSTPWPNALGITSRSERGRISLDAPESMKPYQQAIITPPDSPECKPSTWDVSPQHPAATDISESNEYSNPLAIKELLINAEGLLSRLQLAYTQRTSAYHEMSNSRNTLADKLEESNTRIESLRSQLVALANSTTNKDQRIAELERELSQIKMQNISRPAATQLTQPPNRTSSELKRLSAMPQFKSHVGLNSSNVDEDISHNDLGFDIDTCGDSDCESVTGDSIFSRPRSPTLTTASSILSRSPNLRPISTHISTPFSLGSENSASRVYQKFLPQPQKTFFSYLIGRTSSKEVPQPKQVRCTNCFGKDPRAAWDTVSLLRIENMGLKERIVELEDAVDGALEIVMRHL